jgi:subtilase family serine protease
MSDSEDCHVSKKDRIHLGRCEYWKKRVCKRGHVHRKRCICDDKPEEVDPCNVSCVSYLRLNRNYKEDTKEDVEVKAHAVTPSYTAPLSFDNLKLVYGYPTFPALGVGKKRTTVAIVGAYLHRSLDGTANINKSMAPSDLAVFCSINGYKPPISLPAVTLLSTGTTPTYLFPEGGPYFLEAALATCPLDPSDSATAAGWSLENSLDFQSIYGMTNKRDQDSNGPNIILVHSNSANFSDMSKAVASALAMGAEVVSLSWGAPEFIGEARLDTMFNNTLGNKATFVVSTGDDGYGSYPAFSPYVVAVGGTSLVLNGGTRVSESAWGNANGSGNGGGGVSGASSGINKAIPVQEPSPAYQSMLGYKGRSIPDISLFASNSPGVQIVLGKFVPKNTVTTYQAQSYAVGGTSLSAPCMGSLVSICNQNRINNGKAVLTSNQVLNELYNLYKQTTVSSYCKNLIYNVVSGTTYLATQNTIITRTGRTSTTTTTWVYTKSNSAVPVGKGYDNATGLGVPCPNLAEHLISLP